MLTASGGLTGTFSSVILSGFGSGLSPVLGYDADSAFLTFGGTPPPVTPVLPSGTTTNGNSVAAAINFAMAHDNAGTAFASLGTLPPDQFGAVLAQMSGEVGTGLQTMARSSIDTFLSGLLDPSVGGRGGVGSGDICTASDLHYERVADEAPNDETPYEDPSRRALILWSSFHYDRNRLDADVATGTHQNSGTGISGMVGLDYTPRYGNGAVGIAFGVDQENWKLAKSLGKGEALALQVGAYYSRRFARNYYFDAAFSYAAYHVTTDRSLSFNGNNLYHASFNASSESARFEFGHVFKVGQDELTPYVRFTAQDLGTPNYAESTLTGSTAFALSYTEKQRFDYTSELGAAWNSILSSDAGATTGLRARLGWLHDYGNGITNVATFSAFNGASFNLAGASPAKDAVHFALGVEYNTGHVALTLDTDDTLSTTEEIFGGRASVAYRW